VTGEYRKGKPGGRLVRWPLDAPSDRLAGGADVHANGAYVMPLTSDVPGNRSKAYAWGYGAEDLTFSPLSGRI
jgi:hypothetical protein